MPGTTQLADPSTRQVIAVVLAVLVAAAVLSTIVLLTRDATSNPNECPGSPTAGGRFLSLHQRCGEVRAL